MIRVSINGEERSYEGGIDPWINQQINRRRDDNRIVCVVITVNQDPVNLILRTQGCAPNAGGRGSPRQLTEREEDIFALWSRHGLDDPHFTGGNVIAFLKQLRNNS
jgi:hypothetical protein